MTPLVGSGSIHEAEREFGDPGMVDSVKLFGADGTTKQNDKHYVMLMLCSHVLGSLFGKQCCSVYRKQRIHTIFLDYTIPSSLVLAVCGPELVPVPAPVVAEMVHV